VVQLQVTRPSHGMQKNMKQADTLKVPITMQELSKIIFFDLEFRMCKWNIMISIAGKQCHPNN